MTPHPGFSLALRRAFFYALWGAVVVLPLWVLLSRAFFGAPLGYQFLAQIVLVPLLFVGQIVVTLVHFLRGAARRDRALSWSATGLFALVWLGELGIGFFVVDSAPGARASAFTALVGTTALGLSTALSAASIIVVVAASVALLVVGFRQVTKDARRAFDSVLPGPKRSFPDPERTITITPRR